MLVFRCHNTTGNLSHVIFEGSVVRDVHLCVVCCNAKCAITLRDPRVDRDVGVQRGRTVR